MWRLPALIRGDRASERVYLQVSEVRDHPTTGCSRKECPDDPETPSGPCAGVEEELYPPPMSDDPEEDRRLLYVAITRARLAWYLTMANNRKDATAFSGSGDSVSPRSRCDFLSVAGIRPVDDSLYLAEHGII